MLSGDVTYCKNLGLYLDVDFLYPLWCS